MTCFLAFGLKQFLKWPEGERDFFDVGHFKNCVRPKAKRHVTEYPHLC